MRFGICLAALAFGATTVATAAPTCAPKGSESAAIQTAKEILEAGKVDDLARIRSLITSDFYAYDNGKRYDGMALFEFLKSAHAQGRKLEWNVTSPEVRLDCTTALVIYVNKGAAGDAKGMQPMTWLEDDNLRWEDGRWKVAFLHSTRAAP